MSLWTEVVSYAGAVALLVLLALIFNKPKEVL